MALSRQRMLNAFVSRDRRFDGRFLTGVVTTGIYCLPSCSARKPRPENVRFYQCLEQAEAAGFRACRRCRPDRFYQGEDPDRSRLEAQVAVLGRDPSAIGSVRALATAIEVGTSKLTELVRHHYHLTPAELLVRLRVARACRLLVETQRSAAEIAFDVGFGGLSSFGKNVRRITCMTPSGLRALRHADRFVLALPLWLAIAPLLRYLGRDAQSLTERVKGHDLCLGVRLGEAQVPARLHVVIESGARARRAQCRLESAFPMPGDAALQAHRILLRLFGLGHDPRPFERRSRAEPRMAALVARQRGLVVPRTRDVFEGLLWVIAGQQVSLASAFALRRRLIARTSTELGDGLYAPPTAAAVAALSARELRALGFSARKATGVLAAATDVTTGNLPLETDFALATRIEPLLLARAGFGPWSVGYLLMRTWGFADCVPVGDVALARRLAAVYGLDERPDPAATRAWMMPFSPDRSLATFHLWYQPPKDQQP